MSNPTPAKIVTYVAIALAVVLGLGTLVSGYTAVKAGQVAVIKNNITGQETVQTTEGIIIHLPWGITDVYVLDVAQRSLSAKDENSVIIKTREGANVDTNVEVTFNILPAAAGDVIRNLGQDQLYGQTSRTEVTSGASAPQQGKVDDLVTSYVRAKIRDAIGVLNLEELARPEERTTRIEDAKNRLNDELKRFGIEIQTVSATDWDYDDKYEEMIKRRKEADQIYVNQGAAQETNRKKQETNIAEQNRLKSNAEAVAAGDANREVISKEAWAVEQRAKAEGDAYKTKKEAEGMFLQMQNEAAALETELTKRAEGIKKLAEAYATGGIGLVKEALATKLEGSTITGRPWSNDAQPNRVQVENITPAAQQN